MPTRWQSLPTCARSCRRCARPWTAASARTAHFLLERMLVPVEGLEDDSEAISAGHRSRSALSSRRWALLCTIPGIERRTVEVIMAETGGDMSAFPTAKHLASWRRLRLPRPKRVRRQTPGRARLTVIACHPDRVPQGRELL